MDHYLNDKQVRLNQQAKKKPEPGSGKSRETHFQQQINLITLLTNKKKK